METTSKQTLKYDPGEIAEQLIQEHGIQGARDAATQGISEANRNGGLHDLSVWRNVRNILRGQ